MSEIEGLLKEVESNSLVNSAVIISGKSDNFIVGADINMLQALPDAEAGYQVAKEGHRILDLIANSNKPIIAAIHGSCLGGGLEVMYL